MAAQTILFTVMPRSISIDPKTMPVSVYVSPRLFSDARRPVLSEFPDWLNWTRWLQESGLKLNFRCDGKDFAASVPVKHLRPELWEAIFKKDTWVQSHTFDDYSEHHIVSYSNRSALSLLKGLYQRASVDLSLPDGCDHRQILQAAADLIDAYKATQQGGEPDQRSFSELVEAIANLFGYRDRRAADMRLLEQTIANLIFNQRQSHFTPDTPDLEKLIRCSNYDRLQTLVGGLAVDWNDHLRDYYRDGGKKELRSRQAPLMHQPIGDDGLYRANNIQDPNQLANVQQGVAQEFAVAHHIPQGTPLADNPPDFENMLDFHQVLSSLNSYPELLRALGLVIDFELPRRFVALTASGTLSVTDAVPEWQWRVETSITPVETFYAHVEFDNGPRIFLTLPNPQTGESIGLLNLHPQRFGLAQVDIDGGMHKTMMLAGTVQELRDEKGATIPPARAQHPQVFDPNATLPSLRSGGFSLFADERGEKLLQSFQRMKDMQQKSVPGPFYAEDLIHGYRIDIWDNFTREWHSLHRRNGVYSIEDQEFTTTDEEGFTQLAAAQPAPDGDTPPDKDLYLHESIARWAGWSLSVPFPGKALSSDPDPEKALDQSETEQNTPATPFQMTTDFKVFAGSLPSLRFGRTYRLRARVVDICGNSLTLKDPLVDQLSGRFALPQRPEGFAYLRYEPVIAPQVVLRDEKGVTEPGSQLDRLVIRTYNSDPSLDGTAADLTASDRHILPPRTSVEMAERMGMLDDETGKINPSPALYNLLAAKDGAELHQETVHVAGQDQQFPLERGDRIDQLPFIPDVLASGAALRNLPGTPEYTLGAVQPGVGAAGPVAYSPLDDPNPRPGSATLVGYGGAGDWQNRQPFRLALSDGEDGPHWDAQNRVLTVSLPKGTTSVVPLTSYLQPDDLKLMGIWQWLREYIEQKTVSAPDQGGLDPRRDVDRIAHILQRAVEGAHWMLTPPLLLTLVHAVQQPVGLPTFTAIPVQHEPYHELRPDKTVLQTVPEVGVFRASRTSTAPNPIELNAITSWRRPGSTDAYLLGGLHIHAASTDRVDLLAEWDDPVDDTAVDGPGVVHSSTPVDEVPISQLNSHLIRVTPTQGGFSGLLGTRAVGYYNSDHDLLCFARRGDRLGNLGDLRDTNLNTSQQTFPNKDGVRIGVNAAPRHQLNDTKHHRIHYTARVVSRYREYFPETVQENGVDKELDFTRSSDSVVVDVPASARPVAPLIAYVIPTFGWQRQTQTNLKRSVRFGGGLRVYLERPWYSSGEGELLGVTLFDYSSGEAIGSVEQRDKWKSFITQWGNDPIWQTSGLPQLPGMHHFSDAVAMEQALSLEEDHQKRVNVVGYPAAYDPDRQKWYCDLTIDAGNTYSPFIRLALVRYQPCALADAKLSRVVLADFAQLTSDRAAVVTADPYHPRRLQVTISGVSPRGPLPIVVPNPTSRATTPSHIEVEVQQLDEQIGGDLGWKTVDESLVTVQAGSIHPRDASVLWTGTVRFTESPQPGQFRLLICEYENISAEYTVNRDGTTNPAVPTDLGRIPRTRGSAPRRLVYAETIAVDAALVSPAAFTDKQTRLDEE
jgi:hypothetical protein